MTTPLDLDGLHRLLWGFAGQRVITVAGRTGILRRLAAGPATTARIAAELNLDPLATGKVVRALAALGLAEASDDAYRIAQPLVRYLQEGPDYFLPFIEHAHGLYDRWGENLEEWLRGGEWRTHPRSPDDTAKFGAAMQAMGTRLARQVAAALDLSGVGRMLDVGGGFGHYAQAFCQARPELVATVLDLPEVAAMGRQALAGTDLEDRIELIGGDYLERPDYGSGYDLVLFANVLHQEPAERAAAMIGHGAAALSHGGRIAVVDFAIDDAKNRHLLGTLFAINMRSFGDTHSEPAIRGWLEAAGLAAVERIDLSGERWLIVGRKP